MRWPRVPVLRITTDEPVFLFGSEKDLTSGTERLDSFLIDLQQQETKKGQINFLAGHPPISCSQ